MNNIIEKVKSITTKTITINILAAAGIGLACCVSGYCLDELKHSRKTKIKNLSQKYNKLLDKEELDKEIAKYKDLYISNKITAEEYNKHMNDIQEKLNNLKSMYLLEKKKIIF